VRVPKSWEQTVVGLDLSLQRPAACIIPGRWRVGDWNTVVSQSWEFSRVEGEGRDFECRRIARLVEIAATVCHFAAVPGAAIAAEGYAFSRRSASVTKLAELGGVIRARLAERHRVFLVPVTASTARKFLLGYNPRSEPKKYVQAALRDVGAPFWEDPDQCDAFACANVYRAELGMVGLTLA
jgi:hypothetical protein